MSVELIGIVTVGVALAGVILTATRGLRQDLKQGKSRLDERIGGLVFPGSRPGTMLDRVMTQVLRNASIAASGHGSRSSFKDWARQHDVEEVLSELAARLNRYRSHMTESRSRR